MGLAASQARLLSLTARQHAIEYDAQRLEAQKLQLANESDQVYQTYLERLDATKIQYKSVANDGSTLFIDGTFSKMASKEVGFLFNVNGTICNTYDEVCNALKEQGICDITAGDSYTVLSTLVSEGYVVIMQPSADPEACYEYDYDNMKVIYNNPDTGNADPHDPAEIEPKSGKPYIYKVFEDTSISSSTKVQEVSDEVNLRKAEAEYEADMNRINAKDSRYDTQLSQLETERNAIKTEIDSLKNVAKDNVDRTFKIFT